MTSFLVCVVSLVTRNEAFKLARIVLRAGGAGSYRTSRSLKMAHGPTGVPACSKEEILGLAPSLAATTKPAVVSTVRMNQADKDDLASLRARIDAGEEFNPTLLVRYQALVARDARERGKFAAVDQGMSSQEDLLKLISEHAGGKPLRMAMQVCCGGLISSHYQLIVCQLNTVYKPKGSPANVLGFGHALRGQQAAGRVLGHEDP